MSTSRNDTYKHQISTELGAHVRIAAEHGRIYLVVRASGSRIPLTIPMPLEQADELFERGREIIALRRAETERRGA